MPIDFQMTHVNSNAVCSIWIETTGPIPGHHDLIRIAILLLDNHLEISQKITPFYLDIVPKRLHNLDRTDHYKSATVSRRELFEIIQNGHDAYSAADRFEEWIHILNLPWGKKIVPIAYNWPQIYPFLVDWLGPIHAESFFSEDVRDLRVASLISNDRANLLAEPAPYPKSKFGYICSQLKVHRPSSECISLAYCVSLAYKRMLQERF